MLALLDAIALLLVVAGAGKLVHPAESGRAAAVLGIGSLASPLWVRLFGAFELIVGASVVAVGGVVPAGLAAVAYSFLAVVAWRLLRVAPAQDCGCFGKAGQPITRSHLLVDICCAAVALMAVRWPQRGFATLFSDADLVLGATMAAMSLLLAWLLYEVLTTAPKVRDLQAGLAVR